MKKDKLYYNRLSNAITPKTEVNIDSFSSFIIRDSDPGEYFEGELHKPWELVYVIEGTAGIVADQRKYTLPQGSIVFHKPLEFHKIWAESKDIRLFIASFNLSGSMAYKLENGVFALNEEEKIYIKKVIDIIEQIFGLPYTDEKHNTYIQMLSDNPVKLQQIKNLLEILLLSLINRGEETLKSSKNESSILFSQIVRVMEENVYGDITISDIADQCNVSAATVKNCVSRHAGCGVHKYFLKIKVRVAIELMREGISVSEVSNILGFNNPNYFTYAFKRETGYPPSYFK